MDQRINVWLQRLVPSSLYNEKAKAIVSAVELYYADSVLERILSAKTDREITRALQSARV